MRSRHTSSDLCNRMNRSHKGCGKEGNGGDVVGLRLRLNDELYAGASLEWLGEVTLLAPGYDVVVKGLKIPVGDDGNPKGGVLETVLGSAADGGIADGAEEGDGLLGLHGVLLFARSLGTHIPKGRKGALLPSRGIAALPRAEVFGVGTRSLRGGRSPKPGGRGTRVLNAEPKGAAPAPKRWPSERASRRTGTNIRRLRVGQRRWDIFRSRYNHALKSTLYKPLRTKRY